MNKTRIAISGKARVGKNSVAEMIVKHSKIDIASCKIVALADPMKNIAMSMFPEAKKECLFGESELRSHIISNKYKDSNGKPLTYRQFLLDLGAFGRKYLDTLWLNLLVEDAKRNENNIVYIVSDVRYINEYSFLKDAGFYMMRIKRPDYTKIDDASETQQDAIKDDEFDYVIDNIGSLEDLSNKVKDITANIMTNKSVYE